MGFHRLNNGKICKIKSAPCSNIISKNVETSKNVWEVLKQKWKSRKEKPWADTLCGVPRLTLVCHRQCPKSKVNGRSNQTDIPPNGVRFLITSVVQALVCRLSCRVAPGYIIHTCHIGTSNAFRWHFVAVHCLCGRQWQSWYAIEGNGWYLLQFKWDFSTVCPRSKALFANEARRRRPLIGRLLAHLQRVSMWNCWQWVATYLCAFAVKRSTQNICQDCV